MPNFKRINISKYDTCNAGSMIHATKVGSRPTKIHLTMSFNLRKFFGLREACNFLGIGGISGSFAINPKKICSIMLFWRITQYAIKKSSFQIIGIN